MKGGLLARGGCPPGIAELRYLFEVTLNLSLMSQPWLIKPGSACVLSVIDSTVATESKSPSPWFLEQRGDWCGGSDWDHCTIQCFDVGECGSP